MRDEEAKEAAEKEKEQAVSIKFQIVYIASIIIQILKRCFEYGETNISIFI